MTSAIGTAVGTGVANGVAFNSSGTAAGVGVATGFGAGGSIGRATGIGAASGIAPTSIPTWPAGIPYAPQVDSWQMPSPYMDPLATDMDGGNQRLRSRPGAGIKIVQFNITMTLSQYASFRTFCETTLGFGSSRWVMLVWFGTAFVSSVVQFDKGKPPQGTALPPNLVSVQMSLRVFP